MPRPRTVNRHLPPRMQRKGRVYYYVARKDGKNVWIRLSDRYPEAVAMWAEMEGKENRHGRTVSDAIHRFLAECLSTYSEKTQKEWPRMAQKLAEVFGDVELADVKPHHIAAYLDRRKDKSGKPVLVIANREIGLLSTIYSFAMRWGWCDINPTRGVRRNKEQARDRYITDAELLQIRQHANPQWQIIIDLAYLTALRRGDLMRLQLTDIQDDVLVVRPSKTAYSTRKKLAFEMTPELQAVLDRAKVLRRRADHVHLFSTRDGQPFSENGWLWAWKRLCQRAQVEDAHFHDIRAKALTDASRQGGRDYAQALAGHADGSMTETYIRARETQKVLPLGRVLESKE